MVEVLGDWVGFVVRRKSIWLADWWIWIPVPGLRRGMLRRNDGLVGWDGDAVRGDCFDRLAGLG